MYLSASVIIQSQVQVTALHNISVHTLFIWIYNSLCSSDSILSSVFDQWYLQQESNFSDFIKST